MNNDSPNDKGTDHIRGIGRAFMESDSLKKLKKKRGSEMHEENVATEQLIGITEESQEELMSVSTVFPFKLFPDTVTVDRQKVSIIHRDFFRTANNVSVKIGDVLNVESHVGPFLGSIRLYSKYFVDNYHEVSSLSREDAIKLHQLLQGYMIAHEKEIDCSEIDKHQLVALLNELGHPQEA